MEEPRGGGPGAMQWLGWPTAGLASGFQDLYNLQDRCVNMFSSLKEKVEEVLGGDEAGDAAEDGLPGQVEEEEAWGTFLGQIVGLQVGLSDTMMTLMGREQRLEVAERAVKVAQASTDASQQQVNAITAQMQAADRLRRRVWRRRRRSLRWG